MNCYTLCLLWKMENDFITKSPKTDKTVRNRKVFD